MKSRTGSLAVLAIATAGAILVATAATPGTGAATPEPCTAAIQPDSVKIRQEPMTVTYALSEDIGPLVSVTPPEDSGLEVLAFHDEDKALELDTGGALEGAWTLRFVGDAELTCTGTLTVLMAGAGRR